MSGALPAWSELYAARRAVRAQFGAPMALPLATRATKVLEHALPADAVTLLEVGAGDRRLAAWLAERRPNLQYQSVDIDDAAPHDFASLTAVQGTYDVIVAFEWIEHLHIEDVWTSLRALAGHLKPGGILVLSTPNIHHPTSFLRDITHRTPFAYDELGGLLQLAGYQPQAAHRLHQAPFIQKWARRLTLGWLHRAMGVDYAPQITWVATRGARTERRPSNRGERP